MWDTDCTSARQSALLQTKTNALKSAELALGGEAVPGLSLCYLSNFSRSSICSADPRRVQPTICNVTVIGLPNGAERESLPQALPLVPRSKSPVSPGCAECELLSRLLTTALSRQARIFDQSDSYMRELQLSLSIVEVHALKTEVLDHLATHSLNSSFLTAGNFFNS